MVGNMISKLTLFLMNKELYLQIFLANITKHF